MDLRSGKDTKTGLLVVISSEVDEHMGSLDCRRNGTTSCRVDEIAFISIGDVSVVDFSFTKRSSPNCNMGIPGSTFGRLLFWMRYEVAVCKVVLGESLLVIDSDESFMKGGIVSSSTVLSKAGFVIFLQIQE